MLKSHCQLRNRWSWLALLTPCAMTGSFGNGAAKGEPLTCSGPDDDVQPTRTRAALASAAKNPRYSTIGNRSLTAAPPCLSITHTPSVDLGPPPKSSHRCIPCGDRGAHVQTADKVSAKWRIHAACADETFLASWCGMDGHAISPDGVPIRYEQHG